ncbi:MAG: agmatine deiminase family protein [Solirubrobacteraceae bacterium]
MSHIAVITRRRFLASAAAGAGTLALGDLAPTRAAARSGRAAGFRVPLDSVPHTRTWMAWPDSVTIWGRRLLAAAQADIARIASTIAHYEPVVVLANRRSTADARSACGSAVEVIDDIPINDCWMRDTGPIFRLNGRGGLDAIGLNFNAWGDKQRHNHDALVARRIAARLGVSFTAAGLVTEGGAIETDGHGTLMATESSIINPNRNPGRTRTQLEAAMNAAYGASEVIWLKGIRGQDITDDHVDSTSRFTAPATGMVQYPRQASDHNMWSNDERRQYRVLSHADSPDGTPIATTKLLGPTWSRIRQHRDNNFVDSYANYYVCNGAVICAQFGDADADADAQAAATIGAAFPGRVIEPLNIDALGIGGGGIHCVTQQQPAP